MIPPPARVIVAVLALSLLGASCGRAAESVTVEPSQPRQAIDGFGAGMRQQTSELEKMTERAQTEVLSPMVADVVTRLTEAALGPAPAAPAAPGKNPNPKKQE